MPLRLERQRYAALTPALSQGERGTFGSRLIASIGAVVAWLAFAIPASADETPVPKFAQDVQPLLKRHCLKCHGTAKREAGLDLSTPGGVIRGGKNGAVITPHDLVGSLFWKRVSEDEMPPEEPLGDRDKEIFRRWIAAGAPGLPARETVLGATGGRDHWAFQPLRKVPLPDVREIARVRNGVDRFIQAGLEGAQLSLGAEAPRPTLIRRVAFDLTGLPPTPAEIAAFVADKSPDAYEQMVDRYLASPHYGERWGKYWLDAAGYADSNGYFNADSDRPLAWRYRDWVARAVNRDMPFDQFVREQLAGDELANFTGSKETDAATIELLEATHYLRNGQDGSGESDGNPDEVRADRYYALESVVQNVTSSLFGLTIQCAKCHDHKFEPIPQLDYYRLQSIFAPAFNLQQWIKPNERFVHASLPGEFEKWEARVKTLDAELARKRSELAAWVREHRPRGEIVFADDFEEAGRPLAERWSNTAPGDNTPGGKVPVQIDSTEAPGLAVRDGRLLIIEGNTDGDSWVSTRDKIDWTPDEPGAAIQVTFDLVALKLGDAGKPAERVAYLIALHDFNDDSPVAVGNILIDGNPGGPTTVDFDYPGSDSKRKGEIGAAHYAAGRNFGVRVTRLDDGKFQLEHLVDFVPEGKSLVLTAEDLPDGGFGFEYCCQRSFVVDNVLVERLAGGPAVVAAREEFNQELGERKKRVAEIETQRAAVNERPGKIAWVTDTTAAPPDVFLLERGDYARPTTKVEPAGFTVLSNERQPFAVGAASETSKTTGRRLALARWATAPGSVPAALMGRVQVNRVWQKHFGTGIVATTDNLGLSGAVPSHPELLDWLAEEFVGSGWSLKNVHRLIVNSAAYRQGSADDKTARQRDPDDRLLWRFPVRRLDAEAIRDALLAASGDLDLAIGGPLVSTRRTDSGEVDAADGNAGGRRRSLYLQQKRTQVVSLLAVFDAPTIVFNSVQRPTSTMPLQALALLNSEFAIERAKRFAARLERDAPDEGARLAMAAMIAWGREPTERETTAARLFLDDQEREYAGQADARGRAWVDFCQMLLASNEFLYVE